MATSKTNKDLKNLYDKVYKEGKEKFFTFNSDYVGEHLIKIIDFKGKKVLDIGCGTGETDLLMAQEGGQVLAIDYSAEAINITQAVKHPNLEFRLAEYSQIDDTFDVIISLGTIEHQDNPLTDLKNFKNKLKPGGQICFTCPSFLNVRGYIWMTLVKLFYVPMSLTDLHFICPFDVEAWAQELEMELKWETFNFDLGNNQKMIVDLDKRLRNALRDAKLPGNVDAFIDWLKKVSQYDHTNKFSGAMGLYILTSK